MKIDNIHDRIPDDIQESEQVDVKFEIEYVKLEAEIQNVEERKKYAARGFSVVLFWLTCVISIVTLQGFGSTYNFKLDRSIIIALITASTLNVIGILIFVMKYLFVKESKNGTISHNKKMGADKNGS